MCTLAIYVRAFRGFPIVIAANRDEFFARPTSPPRLLDRTVGIFGGRDEVARGTWLAVSRLGLAAALLNRRSADPNDAARRSRGQLCLAMLRAASAKDARRMVESESAEAYNPFNLLVSDADDAWIATNQGGTLVVEDLEPGLHLLTNLDVDDSTCPKIAASYQLFAALFREGAPAPANPEFIAALQRILSAHHTPLD
ncbi:MAG: NRDE family protein, partial [Candidatus Binatia bacterium]